MIQVQLQLHCGLGQRLSDVEVSANAGKVTFEQDDAFLQNPNQIETVQDARQKVKQCANSLQ